MDIPLETPSRILRRIEVLEAQNMELPSLPSFPAFEEMGTSFQASASLTRSLSKKDFDIEDSSSEVGEPELSLRYHSTPAASSHTTRSTVRPPSTSSSATRFANSLRTSTVTRKAPHETFDVSEIRPNSPIDDSFPGVSLPDLNLHQVEVEDEGYTQGHGSMHTSEIRSRTRSPPTTFSSQRDGIPQTKGYDYSVSVHSDPKPSPLRNISIRNPKAILARTRTPSLTRTTPSPTSMSSNSTPRSAHSRIDLRSPSPIESGEIEPSYHFPSREDDVHKEEGGVSEEISMELEKVPLHESQDGGSQGNHSREPTFTSEEQAQSSSSSDPERGRTPYPNAFSSPIQPIQATPTQSFLPKRVTSMDTPAQEISGPSDDFNTPYNRRRSFLLSLVQSSGRPRMAMPTPHPISRTVPTPRPRAHPLSQAWTPHLDSCSASDGGSSASPGDRNSFISTASSHDLTVHPRANASFDPVSGVKHVGRFNAVKLNSYLHGLNRRLQEENEMLIKRLRMLGEEVEMGKMADQLKSEVLEDIDEEALGDAEAVREELNRRESEIDAMQMEHDALVGELHKEIEHLKQELEEERVGRMEDKNDWKIRLEERVEKLGVGFEKEYQKLEAELVMAQKQAKEADGMARRLEQHVSVLEEDLNLAKQRAGKAEDALATSSDLGVELKQAQGLLDSQKQEMRSAIQRAQQLEQKLKEAEQCEEDAKAFAEERIANLDDELRYSLEAQQTAEANAIELKQESDKLKSHLADVEVELAANKVEIVRLASENADLGTQLQKEQTAYVQLDRAYKQVENALEDGEQRMLEDEAEMASLRSKVGRLEQELVALRDVSRNNASMDQKTQNTREHVTEAEIQQLEAELDEAHKEIGRLQHLLSQSPGRKAIEKAKDVRIELLEQEKDDLVDRVRSLTAMLSVSPYKTLGGGGTGQSQTPTPVPRRLLSTWKTPKTPGPALKEYSWLHEGTTQSNSSPFAAQIQHLQHELHLANDSIDEKVNRLEEAGIGIVGLTEKLEDAQVRNMSLEKEIARLLRKDDRRVRRLARIKCLECGIKVDTSKILGVSNASPDESSLEISSNTIQSAPPTPPSKKAEALGAALKIKTSELDALRLQWDAERKQLLGKTTVLEDAANRLNVQLDAAKSEVKRAVDNGRREVSQEAKTRATIQEELAKARVIVTELEESLKNERASLRTLTAEQNRMLREKETIFVQVQRAQSDMDEVRTQLENLKSQNRELEAELRATETVNQKARLLEHKVSENDMLIERLREERETLTSDHASLQRMYQEASAQVTRLRKELSKSQNVHDEHRHQLDSRVQDIEDLRREVSAQALELERIQNEKHQVETERSEIARTVASLEADLKRVRNDAEALGKLLKELKTERAKSEAKYREDQLKSERVQKQLSTQIRLANEQAELQRTKAKKAIADLQSHICKPIEHDIESIRSQHHAECKGLMVQIKYLKAKFTRESVFRSDLGYQKDYLLQLLSKFEKGEKQILAAIARLDYPPHQTRRRLTLRTIAVIAIFISRAKRAADTWREQSAPRTAINAALQDVRRRRITAPINTNS